MDSLKKIKLTAGLSATLLLGGGAAVRDVTVLDIPPIERVEIIAGERVEAKQIDNIVEATFPWKDQPGIKVKYDMGEPTLEEKASDVRKKQVITETVTDFDGGFKVDIILSEKPDTNRFCYTIEGAENYDFFYQPPLTEEEIAEGAERPPEIEGSYAVYHKSLANHQVGRENYATGKVMHILRPQVWSLSDEENKQWADLSYENSQLCVTASQDFLDNATYPVRIDPTFGYTGYGLSSWAYIAGATSDESGTQGQAHPLPQNATIDSMSAGLYASAGTITADLFMAVYREDSAGAGSHDLVASAESLNVSFNTSLSFKTLAFADEVLTADDYVLAVLGNGEDVTAGEVRYNYDTAGSNFNRYSEYTTGAGSYATRKAENPWTETASAGTQRFSFYATYSTADVGTFTDYYLTNGNWTWTAPTGVTSADVACWGAGGGGGFISASGGAGGGGGAFASSTLSVTAGTPYSITIGAGGPADSASSAGASSFASSSCPSCVVAAGGQGASPTVNTTEGAGGTVANSTGTIEFAGGAGGDGHGTNDVGGGGGGAGGPHGDGVTALSMGIGNTTGGAGGKGSNHFGGAGGASSTGAGNFGGSNTLGGGGGGGANDNIGGAGGFPGGGGGGGETGGGIGASGQCTITYTVAAAEEEQEPTVTPYATIKGDVQMKGDVYFSP